MNDVISCKITVFFDNQFWIGIYEKLIENKLEVARIIFASEPQDYEIYEYLNFNYIKLKFSPIIKEDFKLTKKLNPKRMQKLANQQLMKKGIRTKAQEALQLQQEKTKFERKKDKRKKIEEEKQMKFSIRQKKRKEKHRGH